MASMVMRVLCAIVIVACMVVVAPYSDAITCGQVTSSFVACFGYLKQGGAVPPACCRGVVGLNNTAKTTLDRQIACGCMKEIYASTPDINISNAISLPGKCGINVPYKITPDFDCSKVHAG